MTTELRFFVPGKPQTAGSKRSPVPGVVMDDNPRAAGWKRTIAQYALIRVGRPLWTGPVAMHLVFLLRRPKAHHVGGRRDRPLRREAPEFPTGKPDTLKLARAVEDGLTGFVYVDDAQIVTQVHEKKYAAPDAEEGAHITVARLC